MNELTEKDSALAPDAPIIALLRLRDSALIAEMSDEELTNKLREIRALAQQPVALVAKVKRESTAVAGKVGGRVSKLTAKLNEI